MKKKIVIIGIMLMLFVFGVTYAWWNWQSSTNTNVTFNVEGATVTYSAGNNISGIKLIPVSSKEKGVTDNTAAYKEITASSNKTMYLTLNLDLTTFPSQLADASLVWEIYKGNTKIGNGNFSGKQQGNSITLFKDQEINSTESLYKLYIWIDGTQSNPNTMMNQDFIFTLNASATDEAPTRLMAQPVELSSEPCEQVDSVYGKCRNGDEYSVYVEYNKTNILGRKITNEELEKVNKIVTVASKTVPANAIDSWDVSEAQNGSVMAWYVEDSNDNTKYDLYIGQDGGVIANPNSSYLFANYWYVTNIDLSNFDTSNVIDMSYMFSSSSLTTLNLGNNFDTSNVTNMSYMFTRDENLTTLNLGSKFDTSNVTDMSGMFALLDSLTTFSLGSNFNTSNVTNMRDMFESMESLTTLNLGDKFDTSNVTDMAEMFLGMSALTSLNLGNKFDTSNITDMRGMFALLDSLTTLNLGSKFNTSNVEYMSGMFYSNFSSNLEKIYVASDFDTSSLIDSYDMFTGCRSLVGGNNTAYNNAKHDATYAKIDRVGTPGYFTDIATLNS